MKTQKIALAKYLSTFVLLLELVLATSLFFGCGGEHPVPVTEFSAASEGLIKDKILFCEYQSGYLVVDGNDTIMTDRYFLYSVNTDGTELTKLLDIHTPDARLVCFDLSPDRNRVAFFSTDGYLSVLGPDSGEITRVVEALGASIAWSPDGTKLAYTSGGDLFVVNADGSDNKKLAEHKSGLYHEEGKVEGYVHCPIWSADRRRILFDNFMAPEFLFGGSALDIRNRAIYAVDVATSDTQVLQSLAKIVGPGPEESKITIMAHKEDDDKKFIMNDDGTICPEYQWVSGKWSPDGSATANVLDWLDKFFVHEVTGEQFEIEIEGVTDFIWSPNSQYIAYTSDREIHIISRDLSQEFLVHQATEAMGGGEERHMKLKLVGWLSASVNL